MKPSFRLNRPGRHVTWVGGALVFASAFLGYLSTLAAGPAPGDPSEYTFIPWILGIAHPPGYAFYTLLAALWQRLAPIGAVAYRTHLLAAAAGSLSATLVYATVLSLLDDTIHKSSSFIRHLAAIFAALSLAFATDIWQHSIHANAHVVTLLLATASIFALARWRATGRDGWLYVFALVAGISPAQHPLLVFGFPAYALFILAARPGILRMPGLVLKAAACFALGLSVFLYYPLRSPTTPFGARDITSWDSFVHFVTAEGLRVNLFAFGPADQPARFGVFLNLLQLQYPLFTIALAAAGWIALFRRSRPASLLASLFLAVFYAFIMNTIQDVMAYLMLPFMLIAVLAGVGTAEALSAVLERVYAPRFARIVAVFAAAGLIGLPAATALLRAPRLTLRDYTAGADWVRRVYDRFEGKGEGAFLLAPWEALTPLWVEQHTNDRPLDPDDVTLVYVAASSKNPWLDNVFAHFELGPVYLADYRREVVEGSLFRLRPDGGDPPLWRVVTPGDTRAPELPNAIGASAEGQVELLSYALHPTALRAGDTAYLTLAMRAPATLTNILSPYALLGDRAYRWTTDSRALSTQWLPGEVIVERYEIALPFSTPPGEYPLALGVTDLNENRDLELAGPRSSSQTVSLGTLRIDAPRLTPDLSGQTVMADFSSQAALVGASATAGGRSVRMARTGSGAWTEPLAVRPGESIQVWLEWQAMRQPLDNYKVFVHLITPGEQLAAPPFDFYTPMGGAFPTLLWIPRWIEGQRISDGYTLNLPPDLPPGDYRIQIGWYGLTSNRRVYLLGADGQLAGDRVILGPVRVSDGGYPLRYATGSCGKLHQRPREAESYAPLRTPSACGGWHSVREGRPGVSVEATRESPPRCARKCSSTVGRFPCAPQIGGYGKPPYVQADLSCVHTPRGDT